MTTHVQQSIYTQAFINHSSFAPIMVPATPHTELADQPGKLDLLKAFELLKTAYSSRHNDPRDNMIIQGMLDTILLEIPLVNMHYARTISLGDVTLKYAMQEQTVEQPVVIPTVTTETKDLSQYFQQPATPVVDDEFDINALGNVDFDAVNERVAEMQAGGGEAVEPSNECEGGGCKI